MNLEKWYDRAYDKILETARWAIDLDFDRAWFAWIEWVILAAGVYAVGKKTESPVLIAIGVFSGAVLFFSAWFRTERFLIKYLAKAKKRPFLFWLIVVGASFMPIGVMIFLVGLFRRLVY
ncbi:MAG: hypothetical protein WA277_05650 [Nitrospirota bacterium]